MSDWLWWMIVGVATTPIWGAFLWHTYQFSIRPCLVPQEEIDRLVAEMLDRDDPDEAAFVEEQAAWYRGDTFEQGKWRLVRKALITH